jgi:hypothetical protein
MSIAQREPAPPDTGRAPRILLFALIGWSIATITGLICGDSLAVTAGHATFAVIAGLVMAAGTYATSRQKGASVLGMLVCIMLTPTLVHDFPRSDTVYSVKSGTCFILLFYLFGLIRRMFVGLERI